MYGYVLRHVTYSLYSIDSFSYYTKISTLIIHDHTKNPTSHFRAFVIHDDI